MIALRTETVTVLLLFFLPLICSHALKPNQEPVEEDNGEEESVVDKIIKNNQVTEEGKNSDLFEADIHIESYPEGLKTPYSKIKSNLLKRGLRRSQEYLWVDRVVPYEITEAVEYGKEQIQTAFKELEEQSCITFKEHTNEKHWIRIVDKGACYSGVGRSFWREGSQEISLGRGCMQKGTIMHEILHSLGFWHEQSRPDRDKYVEIFWENVREGEEHNFAKYSTADMNSYNVGYDVGSIMHYGKYSFSKNGEPTMLSVDDKEKNLGQRKGLSKEDALQLNLLYKCKDVGQIYTSWTEWSPCDPDYHCQSSRQRFCSSENSDKCPDANSYGIHSAYRTCPDKECFHPRDGHWNRWSAWTTCDKSCGNGRKTRKRTCDDPKPRYGGTSCSENEMETSDCYIVPCGLGPDDCQFDNQGMCFWKDLSSISYRWQRKKGKTPSGNTGPDQDHSTGKGFYIFAESSAPAGPEMHANLYSKTFPSTAQRCLRFFYSMHGVNIGKLRVYIYKEGHLEGELLWEKAGPQGNNWLEALIDFSSQDPYKIKFEAERGSSFLGDIGLDDIYFKEDSCDGKGLKQSLTTTTTTVPTPPPTTQAPLHQICGINVKPLGCYAEIPHLPAIPNILDSHRGAGSPGYHGMQLSWTNYKGSLNSLFCDCINLAKSRGFKYFGMQFFGECWGVGDEPRYDRYGISTLCIDGNYKPCYHENYQQVCIGKAQTNYVYELI